MEQIIETNKRYGKSLSIYKLMLTALDMGDEYLYFKTDDIDNVKLSMFELTDDNLVYELVKGRTDVYKIYYEK